MRFFRRRRRLDDPPTPVEETVEAVRDVIVSIDEAIAEQVEFDPHWFRRAFHAFGACFIAVYLLPITGISGHLRFYGPLAIFAGVLGLEAYRMSGRVPTEAFFGLREYERRRISGYVYFGAATLTLVYFFPQPIAVACILASAIGDPILGEFRRAGFARLSIVAGGAFILGVFLLIGFHPLLSVFATAIMVAAELTKIKHLDDDLLMPLSSAIVLWAIIGTGLFSWAGVVLPPNPIPTPLEVPFWLR